MLPYIIRRLAQTVLVLLGVTALSFGTMFLSGDPTMLMAGETWTVEQVNEFSHQMGFDRPWYVQYGDFLSKAVRGDFGVSLRQQQPTFSLVMERMPNTLQLAAAALAIALCFGLPVGVLAALRRGSIWDNMLMLGGLLGQSLPVFWLGLLLIMVFSVGLGWFPVAGIGTPRHLVLPAVTLGLFSTAYVARVARSSMLEVLGRDYVRTAHAKGLPPRAVILRHALRNALIPLVTVIGLQAGQLLGGAVITETIFAWPGVGRLTIQAVQGKDLPLVQACVTLLAANFVFINLLVDLLYTYLDPRIRLK
ncbi:MAG TPA: ABC transporter permease [Chloroflexota bacterium]|nr:ABC transporter permease [Chloroflexota bacterium]